jgi:DNA (cytosine-5)-methyltransferase 1
VKVGSLFSGYDGIGLALSSIWPDAQPAWFVEFDPAPSKIVAHHWPTVPNYGDVTAVDWSAVEPVDILTGGFPCQDLSHAGKRAGLRPGTRSGLWEHMAYAVDQLRPPLVVIENVRGLLSASAASDLEPCPWCVGGAGDGESALRALGSVLGDLADLGYDAEWVGVRAADAGAPHGRFRVFIVAHPADADLAGLEGRPAVRQRAGEQPAGSDGVGPESLTLLPTPKASDGPNGGPGMRNGRGEADALPGVVSLLPTPAGGPPAEACGCAPWGPYAPAVHRWEGVLGRPAPSPTHPGKDGRPRLSAVAVEFLMGLPAGHVTDPAIGLSRAQQLKALGNGVVPQQAALALRMLLGQGVAPTLPTLPTLPTPTTDDAGNAAGRPSGAFQSLARTLLPTPAVNDMGEGKTPADADQWTERMKDAHGNGNGHGKSLAIEALRLGASDELA